MIFETRVKLQPATTYEAAKELGKTASNVADLNEWFVEYAGGAPGAERWAIVAQNADRARVAKFAQVIGAPVNQHIYRVSGRCTCSD